MNSSTTVKLLVPAVAACGLLGLAGCTTTGQVSEDKQSGFLRDYSMLHAGEYGAANYIYIDESANWPKYTKIWLKPFEFWKSEDPEAPLGKMSRDSQELLTQDAYNAACEALTNDFQIVNQGGPDVLIVHAALTDDRRSKPDISLASSTYRPAKTFSTAKRLVIGTDLGVGMVTIEAELLDGQTGKRVAAITDARAGTKAIRSKFNTTWGDVKLALDWWAHRLDKRLVRFKQGDFGTSHL